MAQIGLKNLFYAPITENADGEETYGTPVRLAKALTADLTVNSDNATLYADDGADVVLRDFINGTISFNVNEIGNTTAAALLGATVDANGVLVSAGEDNSPAVAVGFQSRSARGGDVYVWLYRVVFANPSQPYKTKGETVEFSTPTIEGTFSRRNKAASDGKHPWKAQVKAGDPGVSTTTTANWFNSVYEVGDPQDAVLSNLSLGSSTLVPTFSAGVTEYTANASGASETLTATAASGTAVSININNASIASGGTASWKSGTNNVEIVVTKGTSVKRYHITVTR